MALSRGVGRGGRELMAAIARRPSPSASGGWRGTSRAAVDDDEGRGRLAGGDLATRRGGRGEEATVGRVWFARLPSLSFFFFSPPFFYWRFGCWRAERQMRVRRWKNSGGDECSILGIN